MAAAVRSFIQAVMAVPVVAADLPVKVAMDPTVAAVAEEVGAPILLERLAAMEALMAAAEAAVGKPQAVMVAFMVEMAVAQIISIVAKTVLVK